MTVTFCSRLAEAAAGVTPGTGVRGDIYVFLPVDKKLWGRSEFNHAWATPTQLEAVRRARRAGVTVRLYDPPDTPAQPAILVHRAPAPSAEAAAALEQLASDLGDHRWALDETGAPRLALCTQGTRDRCCAKFGFAAYRAARKLHDDGRLALAPIECSHLGGDRFAATGIAFPSGSMYGHLDQVDPAQLGEAEADGRILARHYRGRVFESPLTQIVRAGLARDGFDVTTISDVTIANPEDAPAALDVVAGGRSYRVQLSRREFRFFGDCRAVAQNRSSREMRVAYEGAEPVA